MEFSRFASMGSDSIDAGNGRRLTRDSVPISASIESDATDGPH